MRGLIMVMVLFLGVFCVGCSETIVLEENIIENKDIKNFDVVETALDINEDISTFGYVDGKVGICRTKYNSTGKYDYISSFIDKDGNIQDSKENLIFASEYGSTTIYNVEGITQEYDTEKEGSIREFYYRDSLKNITIRLDGFNELTKKYRTSNGYLFEGRHVENNDNYFMILISKYDGDNEKGYLEIDTDEQMIIIIDIENEKMYHKKVDIFEENEKSDDNTVISNHSESKDNCVYSLYYDDELQSIMAITFSNKIKKVNLKNGDIGLEEYSTLNLKGYELDDNELDFGRAISSENFSIRLKNPKDDSRIFAVYNSNSGEVNLLEEGMYVTSELGKYNLVNISYKNEAYLAQIKEDYTVEFIYKFNDLTDENYKCISAYAIMDHSDDDIFVIKSMYGGESLDDGFDNTKARVDYSFIDLKSK